MTQIESIAETEAILATYIPQVKDLLGKDLTLVRMRPMLEKLGNPQDQIKIIHVAGTSGKTSTTYYLAALLAAAGKTVGHTVSPHVDSITERLQINLTPVSENDFCQALGEFLEHISDIDPRPTYFELLIAFVYWYFAKIGVDYAVIETGLGGSFDATNVASRSNKVCVITDIGFDHMHILGHTLPEIAGQKAGIIHPGNQVFMFDQSPAVMSVFGKRSRDQHAILNVLSIAGENSGELSKLPAYQQRNWSLAKHAYDYVANRDSLPSLSENQLAETMHVQVPGRMDIRRVNGKTIIMDGAHNEQKMTAFVDSFQRLYPDQKATIILAQKEGKEYQTVIPLLKPICDRLITTNYLSAQDIPTKSIDPQILTRTAERAGMSQLQTEPNYEKAYRLALDAESEIIIITGSFYLLAALRPFILKP